LVTQFLARVRPARVGLSPSI